MKSQLLEPVTTALRNAGKKMRPTPTGYVVQCPSHDDRNPSLSISEQDGKVLLNCFAGCAKDDIVTALGLAWSDLFAPDIERGATFSPLRPFAVTNQTNAVYPYPNANGEPVGQVIRTESYDENGERVKKGFTQYRYDATSGQYVKGLGSVTLPLFNSPALEAAKKQGEPIYVVEGEKNALDLIEQYGVTATTNSGGANSWRPEHAKQLEGAHVIVVPDKDKQGQKWLQAVSTSLEGVARKVEYYQTKEGTHDISDHWLAGYNLTELVKIEDVKKLAVEPDKNGEPKGRTFSITKLADIKRKPKVWLWRNWLPLGALAVVVGRPSQGKSTVVVDLVAKVTRGELEGQHFGQPRNVIYQATEDDYAVIVNGRLEAAGADLSRVFVIGGQDGEGFPKLPRDAAIVREWADEHDPALIVFDPISDALAEGLDDNKELDVRKALNPLTALARDLDLTVIGIKHFRKGLDGHSQDLMSGSGAWTQVPRTVLHVTSDPEDGEGNARLLYINKTNYGKKGNPLRFVISGIVQDVDGELDETTKVEWVGESKLNPDDILPMLKEQQDNRATETALGDASDFVLELLEDAGGWLVKGEVVQAAENEGIKPATLKRVPKAAGIEIRKDNANKRNTVWIHPEYLEKYEENKAQLEQRSAANRARYASQTAHVSSASEGETDTKESGHKSQDLEAVSRETGETYLEQQLEIGHDYRGKEAS